MSKQKKYQITTGGRNITFPTGSFGSKIGSRKDGKSVTAHTTAELEGLLKTSLKKHHFKIRRELARRAG